MSEKELVTLSLTDLIPLIKKKEISPLDLAEAYLARIKAVDAKIKAYVSVLEEEAIAYARQLEDELAKGQYRGPLHGIPLAIKDNICLKGKRTTHGSKIHAHYVPDEHATVISRLVGAGMNPIGKTNLHEYAMGVTTTNPHHGITRNPWNLSAIPGGSSGGSAAALAANMAVVALGTDTAGSIRIPSACCGTVGLKPTYGRVSRHGVFPLSWTMDHVGPMTRTVQDAAIVLQYMSGFDPKDPSSADVPFLFQEFNASDLRGIVIGIPEEIVYKQVDQHVVNGMETMIDNLKKLGAEIRPVTLSTVYQVPYVAFVTIWVEAAAIHHKNIIERPDDFGYDVRIQLKLGQAFTGVQYIQAQQLRRLIKEELIRTLQAVDALLLPTIPVPAPPIHQNSVKVNGEELDVIETLLRFTSIANVSGLPALAIPSGLSADGLPVGIQFLGRPFDEQTILQIGHQLEQTNPLKGKQPNL